MDKFVVRRAVRIFINLHVGWSRPFRQQNDLAEFLSVRPATVSSWLNEKSDIDFFTFLRICQAFSPSRKKLVLKVFEEFLEILNNQLTK